ncbi:hypothetical protein [Maridesulfovibrio sp.]|uniref:hypothetical protein n=1 Tax=Maridesulfovibrio sp. TaxID=2795000 RepID=UPI0029CA8196|nr:hypothetical protein [Maridesulfovibrio sp.]
MAKKQNEPKAKKVFESKYNPKKLRELIKAGKTAEQIQKEIGIVSKQSLRQHVLRLINEDRTFYEVDGLYERSSNILKAGKYGLKLSLKKLESLGDFPVGTEFTVEADGDSIILTAITDPDSGDGAEVPADDVEADPGTENENEAFEEFGEA